MKSPAGRLLLLLFIFLLSLSLFGQNQESRHQVITSIIIPGSGIELSGPSKFTALAIKVEEGNELQGSYVVSANDTFLLSRDEHIDVTNGKINSNLLSFNGNISKFEFYNARLTGEIEFHFIDGTYNDLGEGAKKIINQHSAPCDEPATIDQSIWRAGLPDPDYTREVNDIHHVIVHHSAGSNSNTDYMQVVRDIYLYHTQVNGWSDIGYNYLVAGDGTIFKGRDPASVEQDNVRGAHFCGKNSLTMGTCLLGTFTSLAPAQAMVNSLTNLITWKLHKENLGAYDESNHPGTGILGAIAGHRDGCSTECPGQKTYEMLSDIKSSVDEKLASCNGISAKLIANFTAHPREIYAGETVTFQDLSKGSPLYWTWDFEGGVPGAYFGQQPPEVRFYKPGIYNAGLVVSNEEASDTLRLVEMIYVRTPELPRVFPNPVERGKPVTLEIENPGNIDEIFIVSVVGEEIYRLEQSAERLELDISAMNAGTYIIHIKGSRFEKKLKLLIL